MKRMILNIFLIMGLTLSLATLPAMVGAADKAAKPEQVSTTVTAVKEVMDVVGDKATGAIELVGKLVVGAVESAQPAAKAAWKILVAGNYYAGVRKGISFSVTTLIFFALCFIFIRRSNACHAQGDSDGRINYCVAAWITGVLGVCMILVMLISDWAIQIMVPEYFALQDLLEIAKNVKK